MLSDNLERYLKIILNRLYLVHDFVQGSILESEARNAAEWVRPHMERYGFSFEELGMFSEFPMKPIEKQAKKFWRDQDCRIKQEQEEREYQMSIQAAADTFRALMEKPDRLTALVIARELKSVIAAGISLEVLALHLRDQNLKYTNQEYAGIIAWARMLMDQVAREDKADPKKTKRAATTART